MEGFDVNYNDHVAWNAGDDKVFTDFQLHSRAKGDCGVDSNAQEILEHSTLVMKELQHAMQEAMGMSPPISDFMNIELENDRATKDDPKLTERSGGCTGKSLAPETSKIYTKTGYRTDRFPQDIRVLGFDIERRLYDKVLREAEELSLRAQRLENEKNAFAVKFRKLEADLKVCNVEKAQLMLELKTSRKQNNGLRQQLLESQAIRERSTTKVMHGSREATVLRKEIEVKQKALNKSEDRRLALIEKLSVLTQVLKHVSARSRRQVLSDEIWEMLQSSNESKARKGIEKAKDSLRVQGQRYRMFDM